MTIQTQTITPDALAVELKSFDAELAEMLVPEADVPPEAAAILAELETAMAEAGLLEEVDEEDSINLGSLTSVEDLESEAVFINNLVRSRAERLIKQLYDFARRHRRCVNCVRSLTRAAVAFRARRYSTALHQASVSYECFLRCRGGHR